MFVLFIMAAIIFLLTVSVVSYYRIWREFGHGKLTYFITAILLSGIMFSAIIFYKKIPTQILKQICLFISAVMFIIIMYSSILFLVRWIILSTAKAVKREKNRFIRFVKSRKRCGICVLGFTFILGIAGFINMGILRETDYDISIDKPSASGQLNAVVVSDTHIGIGLFPSQLDELVQKINACEPDVVFLVGDIIDENTTDEYMQKMSDAFSKIETKYGAYFVYGNHERMSQNDPAKYLEAAGITVLNDEAVTIAGDVTVIGRADGYTKRKELSQIISDEKVDTDKPIIVLNHEPIGLADMGEQGADMTISGHTHGEQFPLTQQLFTLANDMMYGVADFNGLTALTTSGAAGWGFHYKLPARSEVVKVCIEFN